MLAILGLVILNQNYIEWTFEELPANSAMFIEKQGYSQYTEKVQSTDI